MPNFRVPRMQTNAVWRSPPIKLVAGEPVADVDPTGWAIVGAAHGASTRLELTLGNGRLAIDDERIIIDLSEADCLALGPGRVTIEVLRSSPQPAPRPLFRFVVTNHQGV